MSGFPVISQPVFNPLNITLQPGGPAVRVVVTENWTTPAENILQFPDDIEWSLDAVLQPLAITADSAGLNFAAPVGMRPTEAPAQALALNTATGAQGVVLVTVANAALGFAQAPVLWNDGGVLAVLNALAEFPTSAAGLPGGSIWSNDGSVSVVPGGTPPAGFIAPLFFGFITAPFLLELGGAGLPTTNPGYLNQLWNNGGTVSISDGPFLWDDGGLLAVVDPSWPGNYAGLLPGFLWSNPANNGVVSAVAGATPNPSAPPVYFGQITSADLLVLTGTNLPTTNPGSGTGQLWNDGGVVAIA